VPYGTPVSEIPLFEISNHHLIAA